MVSRCASRAASLGALLLVVAGASFGVAEDVIDPNAAADGIYSECFLGMSWSCLQRKALLFIDRMGKSERFPLIADGVVSLVRTGPQQPDLSEESLRSLNSDSLGELMDTTIYDFFQTHVFRFELPSWLKGSSDEQKRSDNAVDFYLGDNIEEGRKKGGLGGGGGHGGGGGKKGMKKMMMMMCMMAASKMMMLVPLMMGLTKMMAMKALIMGVISLTISKIMILKKLKSKQGGGSSGWSSGGSGGGGWSSGGGGGGGWQSSGSGGGGGWDRSFSAHNLAYQGQIDNSA